MDSLTCDCPRLLARLLVTPLGRWTPSHPEISSSPPDSCLAWWCPPSRGSCWTSEGDWEFWICCVLPGSQFLV